MLVAPLHVPSDRCDKKIKSFTFNDRLYNNFERSASNGTHYVVALFIAN